MWILWTKGDLFVRASAFDLLLHLELELVVEGVRRSEVGCHALTWRAAIAEEFLLYEGDLHLRVRRVAAKLLHLSLLLIKAVRSLLVHVIREGWLEGLSPQKCGVKL